MSPGAHLLFSWLSGVEFLKNRRERTLVALTGLAPDLDGLGIIVDKITGSTTYYFNYHHYWGHSIFAAITLATVSSLLSKTQGVRVWFLSMFVVHLHILCDVLGSKGPDGYQWPVYYFYPLLPEFGLTWKYQWELNAWPNLVIIFILFSLSGYYAVTKKITFLEVFSTRLDKETFIMYRKYVQKDA